MTPDALRALRDKYAEIRDLRRADHAEPPRDRMRALAERFPGALRELDELPLEIVDARIVVLDAALAGDREPPEWAAILSRYHGWMRAALRLKRAVGRDRDVEAVRAHVAGDRPTGPDEPSAESLIRHAAAILRPPGGRLSSFVFERLSEALERPADALVAEAFPPSPMRRASRDEAE